MAEGSGEGVREAAYGRADEVTFREIAGEPFLIVLHGGESRMFALNGLGVWFWRQLERPVGKGELVGRLLDEYEVSREAAAAEVDRFLAYLCERGLACARAAG